MSKDLTVSVMPRDSSFTDDIKVDIVLDLDHTLINSFEYGEIPTLSESKLTPFLPDVYFDENGLPELYHGNISNVLVILKLRPSARTFLERLSKATGAKIHVYTKGVRIYMEAALSLLDPTGDLIKGRRFSRDDESPYSDDAIKNPGYLGVAQDTHIVVIDDSPHVWPAGYTGLTVLPATRYDFTERFVTHLKAGISRGDSLRNKRQFPTDSDDYLKEEGYISVVSAFYAGKCVSPVANNSNHRVKHRESFRSASTADYSPTGSEVSWTSATSLPRRGWFEFFTSLFSR